MKKTFNAAVAALVVLSTGSAFAQNLSAQDIANADQSSQAQVAQATAQRRSEILENMRESGLLQGQISQLKSSISRERTVRNVTIVVSASLALASGLLIAKGSKGGLEDLAVGMAYGIPAGGLSALAAVGAGGQQVAIKLDSDKLDALQKRLKTTNDKLAKELSGLN